jgi:O-antigen ligase
MWFEMGIKGAVFLSVILVSVMFIIIDSTVPEGNLRSVLNGLSVGITVLVVNLIVRKFKDKKRR